MSEAVHMYDLRHRSTLHPERSALLMHYSTYIFRPLEALAIHKSHRLCGGALQRWVHCTADDPSLLLPGDERKKEREGNHRRAPNV